MEGEAKCSNMDTRGRIGKYKFAILLYTCINDDKIEEHGQRRQMGSAGGRVMLRTRDWSAEKLECKAPADGQNLPTW